MASAKNIARNDLILVHAVVQLKPTIKVQISEEWHLLV